MAATSKTFLTTEDGLACVTAFGIVVISLLTAGITMPTFGWSGEQLFSKILAAPNLLSWVISSLAFFVLISVVTRIRTGSWQNAWQPALLTVGIAQVALLVAGNQSVKSLNLEAIIFSLLIGLLINHIVEIPDGWRKSLQSELLIKTGLILLGTTIIFSDILQAGALGLIQALVVVITVWYAAFWLCKRFKLDDQMSMMLSSAVSICGVSAAIATAGAIKGDEKKLSFVIALVLVTAIPMMLVMPYLAENMGLSAPVTGAWLGGTIDTTGAVVAAGSLAGETALKFSTIVKFSQNVLLGLAAFAITVYWTYRKDVKVSEKPSLRIIWERFPKFVLGFVIASLIFSFVLSSQQVSVVKDGLKSLQTFFFVIAFGAIGLETRLGDIFSGLNRKAVYAFLLAQLFNIIFTLVIAYFLFSHVV